MKKFFMIAAMMVATLTASAQNEAGQISIMPKAGITLATVTKFNDTKMRVGFVGGVEAEYGISEMFGLTGGLLYSLQGTAVKGGGDNINLHYLNIPILAQVYPVKGLAIKAGIQPGFLLSAKYGSAKIDNKKSFDFAIPVGLSYEISNVVIDARYNIGLTKWVEGSSSKNSVFQFTLGYKFKL